MSKRVLRGSDIYINWNVDVYRADGTRVELAGMSLGVQLIVRDKVIDITRETNGLTITGNVVSFNFLGRLQTYSGTYILKLYDRTSTSMTYYSCSAFIIVDEPAEDVETGSVIIDLDSSVYLNRVIEARGEKGDKGDPGVIGSILTIGENGNWWIDGVDTGISAYGSPGAFKSIVFTRRAASSPWPYGRPAGGSFDHPIPDPTHVTGEPDIVWYDGIPDGNEMIWSSSAVFSPSADQSPIWSTPQEMMDTADYDVEFALKQGDDDTQPEPPTAEDNADGNRHNAVPRSNQIWYDPEQDDERLEGDWSHMYWRAERKLSNGHWGSWTVTRIKGEKGDQGVRGKKSVAIALYKRSAEKPLRPANDPDWPSDVRILYTFENQRITSDAADGAIPAGWSMLGDVSSGNDPLWVIAATASADDDDPDDKIFRNEWSDPTEYGSGAGLSCAPLQLYKRSDTTPLAFTKDTIYDFSEDTLTYTDEATHTKYILEAGVQTPDVTIDGWRRYIPQSGSDRVWVTQAVALGHGDGTDKIEEEEWTPPARVGGEPGINGQRSAVVYLYRKSNSTLTDADKPQSAEGKTVYSFEENCLMSDVGEWKRTIPNQDGLGLIWIVAATASCEANEMTDEIADNEWTDPAPWAGEGINTFSIELYQRAISKPSKPNQTLYYHFLTKEITVGSESGTGYLPTSTANFAGGWSRTIPNGANPCWVTQATAMSYTEVDDVPTDEWSEPSNYTENGQSAFQSTMFVRMNSTPNKPANTDGSYSNPNPAVLAGKNSDNQNVYWSDGIPSGTNIIWATSRIFTSNSQAPQQSEWSDPQPMSDTTDYDVEFALQQENNTQPANPTSNNRHKDDYQYGYSGQIWFDPDKDKYSASGVLRDFTKMFWRAERWEKNGVWSDWTIIKIQGEKGQDGRDGKDGQSTFKSTMFVRMINTPTKPTTLHGSYSQPSPTVLAGQNSDGNNVYWSDGIPEGSNTIWATSRIFTSDGESPQQAAWSDPQPMSDTSTWDVEFAKKQTNDATPASPTTANRHGGSGTQVWFDPSLDTSEDFTKMFWRAERSCNNGVWGSWTILRIQGEKGETGAQGPSGVSISSTTPYYYLTSASSGISAPATNVNPTTQGWSTTPSDVTSANPYLWTFVRWVYSDLRVEQSNAYILREKIEQVQIDYDEIADEVSGRVSDELNLGSIDSRLDDLETNSATTTYVDGTYTNAQTAWETYADNSADSARKAAITSAVSKGTLYWKKTSDGSTYSYEHFQNSGEELDATYETRVKNLGYTLVVIPTEMSTIRQQSDNILLAVGDGTNVAASIKLLKNAQTTNGANAGSKIILDATNVQINGGLTIGAVPEIPGSKIANEAITTTKIQGGAITTDCIAANAITAAKIEAEAITADKIAAEAITVDKLSSRIIEDVELAVVDSLEAGDIKAKYLESATSDGRLATTISPGVFNLKYNGNIVAKFEIEGSGVILKFLKPDGTWCAIGSSGLSYSDVSDSGGNWQDLEILSFDSQYDRVQDYIQNPLPQYMFDGNYFVVPAITTLHKYVCLQRTITGQGTRYWHPDVGGKDDSSAWKTTKPWQDGKCFTSESVNSSDLANYTCFSPAPYPVGKNAVWSSDPTVSNSYCYAVFDFSLGSITNGVLSLSRDTLQGAWICNQSPASTLVQNYITSGLRAGTSLERCTADTQNWDNS